MLGLLTVVKSQITLHCNFIVIYIYIYLRLKFSRNVACRICVGNIGGAVEQFEVLCGEVVSVGEFTYLGDRVSVKWRM